MFSPNCRNIVDEARNIQAECIPLYEHIISDAVLGTELKELLGGSCSDKQEYFNQYTRLFKDMGYDTSFEQCITKILSGAGALYHHTELVTRSRDDFSRYPRQDVPGKFIDTFAEDFQANQPAK